MIDYKTVRLHKQFFCLNNSSDFVVDHKNLSAEEKEALYKWVYDFLNRVDHEGSNKPSWQCWGQEFDDGSQAGYKKHNAWHYHCGPSYNLSKVAHVVTDWWLPLNHTGRESPEVVHYSISKVEGKPLGITVVGFSRNHVPFLSSTAPANPLMARLGTLSNSVDISELDSSPD